MVARSRIVKCSLFGGWSSVRFSFRGSAPSGHVRLTGTDEVNDHTSRRGDQRHEEVVEQGRQIDEQTCSEMEGEGSFRMMGLGRGEL